jgi:hypothetical protein
MTDDELDAIRVRDRQQPSDLWDATADRRALLAEVDRLRSVERRTWRGPYDERELEDYG